VFTLDGVPVEGRSAQEVVDALRAQVAEVAQNGVSAAELQRVKTQWIASETYKLDALFSQARELGTAWLMGFPLDVNSRLVKHLRTITAQEVQQVAQRYFGDAQSTLAVLVPEASAASAASTPGASTASSPARPSAPVR
jgi:zinc protease